MVKTNGMNVWNDVMNRRLKCFLQKTDSLLLMSWSFGLKFTQLCYEMQCFGILSNKSDFNKLENSIQKY